MKVPFLNLTAQYGPIKDEIAVVLQEVLDSSAFAGGPMVERFEKVFAPFCRTEHAIGVGSGTEALWMALLGLGVGPGDEVVTSPNTFIATAEAISFCGATPVFVDTDELTYNISPENIKTAITAKTKAIVPVHLYGQMTDMDPIIEIARAHKLVVVEDACQGHGAEYKGKRAGSIGDAGCFSFYPGKNLGAYGEAGAVTTNNPELAAEMRMFRDHGQQKKYYHSIIGWNARMDGFQGGVLSVKMQYLADWTEARRRHAGLYNELLAGIAGSGITTPFQADYAGHVYHVYAIRVAARRDELQAFLGERGISCGIHYPVPIHLQDAYKFLGYGRGDFPKAEEAASEILSLPMYPELTEMQIRYVCDKIKEFV
ncbi:MAG: DegT/DnrJ/EryC1/StrS family aminotransferase [Thermodesulfobacteriota bacterium]|nr:DegT/DnrJ/EryC1/StrS family aminotransferase [Thermodesulfobacteriota bacterium]